MIAFSAAVAAASSAFAASAPQSVHAEIEALFKRMQSAGCQFNRNSSWYSATKTSLRGKQYLVHCAGMGPTESNVWLQEQLKVIRSER